VKVELLIGDVEVDGRRVSVAVSDGRIVPITDRSDLAAAVEVDGHGGALIAGLHDHHLHVTATAAAGMSVDVSHVGAGDVDGLAAALRAADADHPPDVWLRVVGYHESIAGDLDRHDLDRWVPRRPVRLQDRTGARWTLNSAGAAAVDLLHAAEGGIERDSRGVPTGRLHRADDWLRRRLPPGGRPDLAGVGRRLATMGVVGVTDTTAWADPTGFTVLADAVIGGDLPQRVTVTGGPELTDVLPPAEVGWGPVKVVLDDAEYPAIDELAAQIDAAHALGRSVAFHTVTRASLVLAVAALESATRRAGDRLEHGAVIPPELFEAIRGLALTVVTQPGFVRERGDRYLADVDPDDVPHLYRCRSLLDAGIPVAASSDAPYSDLDPWAGMRTSMSRRTLGGGVLGEDERVDAATALQLWQGAADDPGGPPRRVGQGQAADLVLLDRPLAALLEHPCAEAVVATIVGGRVIHHR
jgi:predicted amidohydrolase YtcJ